MRTKRDNFWAPLSGSICRQAGVSDVHLQIIKSKLSQMEKINKLSMLDPNIDLNKHKQDQNPNATTTNHQAHNSHGFSNFPTFWQTLPIFYLLIISAHITIIALASQFSSFKIAFLTLHYCLLAAVSILWYVTTSIDPTDSIQILHSQAIKNGSSFNVSQFKYFCHICQTCVSKNAFHCRRCCRCVQVFDHHCKWLNNCIGAKNYFQFFWLIIVSQLIILINMISSIIHIILVVRSQRVYPWTFYSSAAITAINMITLCLNSSLVIVHLYLITQKKSTVDLIKEKRKNNKIHPFLKPSQQYSEVEDSSSNLSKNSDSSEIGETMRKQSQQLKNEKKILLVEEKVEGCKNRIRLEPLKINR